ncbi:hypothetical protein GMD78_13125 [Ornithinibacillus sp. L9]|uniref:TniQ domain-containing protein n=1 Tax=Ornithinibacillus caprae TaxID=2678566 RepID=A0A6N8FLR7_9BACI|nr:TniQ family protein [Ornithinibacillus caprae]MUK89314.1 hypothetical protein [Ornithinibacillus caprae]
MGNRLTIRPKPFEYESLSTYVLRVAKANCLSITDIASLIYSKYEIQYFYKSKYRLDLYKTFDITKLGEILKKSEKQLLNKTFIPLLTKLSIIYNWENGSSPITRVLIETRNRKYCPDCLSEFGYYNLIWQFNDIDLCNIHLKKLRNTCPYCHKEQRYFSETLVNMKCHDCGGDLTYVSNENTKTKSKEYIISQNRIYDDYKFLLNTMENNIVSSIKGFSLEQSICIKLLYLIQYGQKVKSENIYDDLMIRGKLGSKYTKAILRIINGDIKYVNVSFPYVMKVLHSMNMSVEQLFYAEVSEYYIESIFNFLRRNSHKRVCLTPWCSSYQKSFKLKGLEKKYKIDKGIKYGTPAVCTGCFITYGVNITKNEWEEVGEKVNLLERVIELDNKGYSQNSILRELSISNLLLIRCKGYLLNHNLIEDNKNVITNLRYSEKEIIDGFVCSMSQTTDSSRDIRRRYQLSIAQYFYFLYSDAVQYYLHFNVQKSNQLDNNNAAIRNAILIDLKKLHKK